MRMKRYLTIILAMLVLASSLLVGCGREATATYYNRQFGYSVKKPESWVVVETPVHWITGRPLKNTIGFRSKEKDIFKADWVSVEVTEKPYWSIYDNRLSEGEYKVHEYGSRGAYLVRYRPNLRHDWLWIIYVPHKGKLYEVAFSNEKAKGKVGVFIDGYGQLN
jgi:hypothetical protein